MNISHSAQRIVRALRPKSEFERKYQMWKTLGSGTFSVVKLAQNRRTKDEVAVKIIDKATLGNKLHMLKNEVEILKLVSMHPNIVRVYDMFETDHQLYIVMELMRGGELFDQIALRGSYAEQDAIKLMTDILRAICHIHDHEVVHRDLKPENILCVDDTPESGIKIADFGLSKIVSENALLKTACGTPGYVAPEVLTRKGYTRQVDVWSSGVILYILLAGYPPFYHDNTAALMELIRLGRFSFPGPYWDNISAAAKDLISRMLVVDPRRRLTVRQALRHPWLHPGRRPYVDLNPAYSDELVRYNMQRKFKSAIYAAVFVHRLVHETEGQGGDDEYRSEGHGKFTPRARESTRGSGSQRGVRLPPLAAANGAPGGSGGGGGGGPARASGAGVGAARAQDSPRTPRDIAHADYAAARQRAREAREAAEAQQQKQQRKPGAADVPWWGGDDGGGGGAVSASAQACHAEARRDERPADAPSLPPVTPMNSPARPRRGLSPLASLAATHLSANTKATPPSPRTSGTDGGGGGARGGLAAMRSASRLVAAVGTTRPPSPSKKSGATATTTTAAAAAGGGSGGGGGGGEGRGRMSSLMLVGALSALAIVRSDQQKHRVLGSGAGAQNSGSRDAPQAGRPPSSSVLTSPRAGPVGGAGASRVPALEDHTVRGVFACVPETTRPHSISKDGKRNGTPDPALAP